MANITTAVHVLKLTDAGVQSPRSRQPASRSGSPRALHGLGFTTRTRPQHDSCSPRLVGQEASPVGWRC